MKPMTVKQLKALLDRAPDDASIWFQNYEYRKNGDLELYHHPVNFAEIKHSLGSDNIADYGVTLSCQEAEEWINDDDEDDQAPIDVSSLTPEQRSVLLNQLSEHYSEISGVSL
jgi:hypothetical protein